MPRHQPPPTTSFPSSSSSDRRSRLRQYASRRRYWLSALAIVFIAVMVVGIIVVAHHYYHDMGGQGYLKRAAVPRRSSTKTHTPNVYLPLRKVEVRDDGESLLVYGVGYIKRSGQDVPFWACGDQQHSCAKFNHPVSHASILETISYEYSGNLLPSSHSVLSNPRRNITFRNLLLQFDYRRCRLYSLSTRPSEMYSGNNRVFGSCLWWVLSSWDCVFPQWMPPYFGPFYNQLLCNSYWSLKFYINSFTDSGDGYHH